MLHWQVRGESGSAFNLLSTPLLSLNADFRAVPPAFRAHDITETVLGSIHVALCAAAGEAPSTLEMDVDSGNITIRDWPAAIRVEEERFICDLRDMRCAPAPLHLALHTQGASTEMHTVIREPVAGALGSRPSCCPGAGWRRH